MKLCDAEKDKSYIIDDINAKEQISGRLEALGMNEGTLIRVLNIKRRGAVIISVRGTRMAMGYGISSRIEVRDHE